ncbi:MAG TPA: DoxX family protein [Ignavibacteria bacterium]|nr:DoxX family protein [Ignavibacteria bacterium]
MISYLHQNKFDIVSLLIRILVGSIFISEGIQKFLYPEIRGVGRFIKIGLPVPEFLGYFVASFEVVCGLLVFSGLFARLAAVPLLIIMTVALLTTKLPILLNDGFWEMAHAARTDWSMLIGSIIIIIIGAGKYSIDKYFTSSKDM